MNTLEKAVNNDVRHNAKWTLAGFLAFVFVLIGVSLAFAQEPTKTPEIIVNRGVAFSDVEIDPKTKKETFTAFDAVAALDDHLVVAGNCKEFSVRRLGAEWCFSSGANRAKFILASLKKETAHKYVPLFGCRCAQGVSNGRLDVAGDPRTAVVVRFGPRPQDESVVCNGSMAVRTNFLGNASQLIAVARMHLHIGRRLGEVIPNDKMPKEKTAQR